MKLYSGAALESTPDSSAASLKRIAVVTPEFPVPNEIHRGIPIYHSVLELSRCTEAQIEVFCPLASYPSWVHRRLNRHEVSACRNYSPPGLRAHYFGYPAFPKISRSKIGRASCRERV